jgi:hypothetical protein
MALTLRCRKPHFLQDGLAREFALRRRKVHDPEDGSLRRRGYANLAIRGVDASANSGRRFFGDPQESRN